jgi:hypothetical protein
MGVPWIGAALVARDVRDDFVLPEPADLAK